jgi:CheY-like chemotaxis protein
VKKNLTTGDVAKICQVAPRTVSQWFDRGHLKGFYLPNSQDRRIPRHELRRFMLANGMPLGEVEGYRVLLIGSDLATAAALAKELTTPDDEEPYLVKLAVDGFAAGEELAGDVLPAVVVIDLAMGRSEALGIVARIWAIDKGHRMNLVALAPEDESDPTTLTDQYSFACVLVRPFSPALLAERLRALTTSPTLSNGRKPRKSRRALQPATNGHAKEVSR